MLHLPALKARRNNMSIRKYSAPLSTLAVCAFALYATSAHAAGRTLSAANNGVDSASCGDLAKPCRSIGQAIANSSDGDTINVGAGVYGDLTGDGTYSHPGDEHPQFEGASPNACVICIDRHVQIVSYHGASVTIIKAPPAPGAGETSIVAIKRDGVRFGNLGAGFTLTGGATQGVLVDLRDLLGGESAQVTIEGNVDLGDTRGYAFRGPFPSDRNSICQLPCGGAFVFSNNQSFGNADSGFSFELNIPLGPITVVNNFASGAHVGFTVQAGGQDELGNAFSATNVTLRDNVAQRNSVGFITILVGPVVGNTAADNALVGFFAVPFNQAQFRSNSALGNGGPGVIVNFARNRLIEDPNPSPGPLVGFGDFSQNNLFGNDRARPQLSELWAPFLSVIGSFSVGPSAHCGVLNVGDLQAIGNFPSPISTQIANNDYWGSVQGPSASGPGDAVGGSCDVNGGKTTAKTFSTQPFSVTTF